MDLKGEYKSFSDITDVLEVLGSGGKSGKLAVSFNNETVVFLISKGKLSDIEVNQKSLSDVYRMYRSKAVDLMSFAFIVLYSIQDWHDGTFDFSEEELNVDDGLNVRDVLMVFGKRKDELEKVRGLIGKSIRISEDVKADFFKLNRFDWHVIYSSACKDMPIKSFISERLPEAFTLYELKRLLDYGLITITR